MSVSATESVIGVAILIDANGEVTVRENTVTVMSNRAEIFVKSQLV